MTLYYHKYIILIEHQKHLYEYILKFNNLTLWINIP